MADDNDATITIGIELDDGTIRKAKVSVDEISKGIGESFAKNVASGVDRSFTGLITQFKAVSDLASKAFGAVSGAVSHAVEEANNADQALFRFNSSLAILGKFTQGASDDFVKFAANLQRVGTVSDDAVISAAGSLVSIGKLSGDALKKASQAGVDLAQGLGTDVASAFDLVAKAAAGNTAALGRYGLKIDESTPKSERFGAVLQLINDRFGGLDAGKANTFGGAMQKLSTSFNDVFESAGKIITGSESLVAVINFLSKQFQKLSSSIEKFGGQKDPLKPIISAIIDFGKQVNTYVIGPLERIERIGEFVFQALRSYIQTAVVSIAGLGSAVGFVLEKFGIISKDTKAQLDTFAESSKEVLDGFIVKTVEAGKGITSALTIAPAVDQFLVDAQRAVDTAAPIMEGLKNNTKAKMDEITNQFALTAKKLAEIVNGSLVNAISQSVQTLVNNMLKGKNAFDGIVKTIGSIFGDMLITIGTTTLLAGIGMEAIRASVVGLTGGPAIFAGIALIAAGTLLKALSGGGGGAETPSAAAGGASGTPTAPGDIAGGVQPPEEQERNRKTQVAINIQGNVLDRKETGLEIANVLQEFFDTQDGVLART